MAMKKTKTQRGSKPSESLIDEAGAESFPASDPLAWNLGTAAASPGKQNKNKIAYSLFKDHELIKKVTNSILILIKNLSMHQQRLDKQALKELVHFFQHFVEQNHHKKENLLYDLLNKQKLQPSSYLLKDLQREHAFGHELLKKLKQLSPTISTQDKAEPQEKIIQLLRDIHHLYLTHIQKEEEYILPHIEKLVDKKTQTKLLEQFEKINKKINLEEYKHLLELTSETV